MIPTNSDRNTNGNTNGNNSGTTSINRRRYDF
jgi:hypothetical protein